MTFQGHFRSPRHVGTPLLVAFLAATVVLSAWLAWEAVDAARSQREVAEEVLSDYAAVAASESARLVRDRLEDFLGELFEEVPRFTRRRTLPGPAVVGDEIDRALSHERCACAGLQNPLLVFRHELSSDEITVSAAGAPQAAPFLDARRLVEALHEFRLTHEEQIRYRGLTRVSRSDGTPMALLFAITRGRDGDVRAVYGMVVELEAVGELMAEWLSGSQLLPVRVMGDTPQDSLLHVRVLSPRGDVVMRTAGHRPSPFSTQSVLPPEQGELVLEVAIRPEAADELVIGGLPRSRLPLLLGLLLVTVGVGGAGLVELRRSHELTRLREDFVSSVSHELRTPLTQIRMLAELLEEEKLPDLEARARSTRIIRREAARLTMLVENVLQFARSRAAAPMLPGGEPPATDVHAVVGEAVALLEAVVARGDATVRVSPRARAGRVVRASIHREALRRVVGNLLDNALKYGPAGQTVEVTVDDEEDGMVRIVVDDQGPGVPPADRDAVWEPYWRLPRDVEARRPGSGLGLAVVRDVVRRYDGSARVDDAPGGGARFTVRIPRAAVGKAECRPS